MEIKFLKALNGDSIHLCFNDGEKKRNILIDGGMPATYSQKDKKGKVEYGDLWNLIESLRKKEEIIDLLILSHVDDDHIGGILTWFKEDENALDLIGNVWFNSGRLIKKEFETNPEAEYDNSIKLDFNHTTNTSIGQGVKLEEIIQSRQHLWIHKLIKANNKISFLGVDFAILSPTESKLKLLLKKWEKENSVSLATSICKNDYNLTIKEHIALDTSFEEDKAIHNGSSISFLLSYESKNFLFLADAHPDVIKESLINYGCSKEKPLKVEFVKLSHHGSMYNNSNDMFELIDSTKYIISTNGKKHNHPHKRLLARLIKRKNTCELYFNYEELIDKIFLNKDRSDFPNLKTLSCKDLRFKNEQS